MKHRIFITGSGIAPEAQKFLTENDCIFQTGASDDTPDSLAEKLKAFNPDALIVRQGKITGEVQAVACNLKVICKHGVGTDNIDIDAASRRLIPVMYTPLANYESVAEHTLALILALMRKIPLQDKNIRKGIFEKKDYAGVELSGKTLGLIGFGRIARRVCELVNPFDVNIIVYHPSSTIEDLPFKVTKTSEIKEVYSTADIISLHCPLTSQTRGLIDSNAIAQMKNSTYLINTARGGIVNETDLIEALEQGRIGGAALDVFETEPPAANNPLLTMENVLVTPHIAGVSDNSYKNMGLAAASNILAVLNGDPYDESSMVNKNIFSGQ